MTPEELTRIREWAEWSEVPSAGTVLALLDHIEEQDESANAWAQAALTLASESERLAAEVERYRDAAEGNRLRLVRAVEDRYRLETELQEALGQLHKAGLHETTELIGEESNG